MGEIDHAAMAALRSGDLVLFGRDSGRAGIWRWFASPGWCDVALVVRPGDDADPLVLQAGSGRGAGVGPGEFVSLARRLRGFRGKVSIRRLNRPLSPAQCERLELLRRRTAAREGRHSLVELMTAGDDGWHATRPEMLGSPTGAELVAESYQHLDLLEPAQRGGRPAHEYSAEDFAQAGRLQLRHGYALGPEVPLLEPDGRTAGRLMAPVQAT